MATLELTLRLGTQDAGFTQNLKAYREALRALHREAAKPMGTSGRRRRPRGESVGVAGDGHDGLGPSRRGRGGRRRRELDPGEEMNRLGARVHHTGLAMERGARRTADALMAVVGPTLDYERAIVDAAAVTSDALGNAANQQKLRTLSMGFADLGHDATSVAEAIGYMGYAGLKTDTIMGAMRPTLDLARAGSVDLAKATDIGTDIMTAFQFKAGTAEEAQASLARVANVATHTFTSANTNLELYSRSMFKVAPIAADLGVSLESTSAAVGVLASAGIKGSDAGTGLRNMFLFLAKGGKPANDALKQIGLNTHKLSEFLIKDDLVGMLNALDAGLQKVGKVKRTEILATIFGTRSSSVASNLLATARSGALTTQLESTREAAAGGAEGIASKVAAEKLTGAAGRVDVMKAKLTEVGITLGEKVLPELLPVAEGFLEVAQSFAEFTKENPEFVRGVAKMLIAMTATMGILGPITTTFGGLIRGTSLLTTTLGSAAGGGSGLAGGIGGLTMTSFRAQGAIGKVGMALGTAGLLGAVFSLSVGLGTAIDRIFGLSDKLSGGKPTTDEKGIKLAKIRGKAVSYGDMTEEERNRLMAAERVMKKYKEGHKKIDIAEAKRRLAEKGLVRPSSEAIARTINAANRFSKYDKALREESIRNYQRISDEVMASARKRLDEREAQLPQYLASHAEQIDVRRAEAERLRFQATRARGTRKRSLLEQAETLDITAKQQEEAVQSQLREANLLGTVDTAQGRREQNWRSLLEVKVNVDKGTATLVQDGREIQPDAGLQLPGMP